MRPLGKTKTFLVLESGSLPMLGRGAGRVGIRDQCKQDSQVTRPGRAQQRLALGFA